MAFTVKFEQLGMKKPLDIKVTNKVLKSTLEMQGAVGKAQDNLLNGEADTVFSTMIDLIETKKNYLKGVLRLTEKQLDMFDELDTTETEQIIGELTNKVLGIEEDPEDSDEDSEGKE